MPAAGAATASATAAGATASPATGPPATGPPASLRGARIKHVVEIMLENHTFDNLFGWLAAPGSVRPVPAPPNEGDVQGGIVNTRAAEFRAMDFRPGRGYLMDRYTDPPFGVQAITTFGPGFDPDLQYLARNYELAGRDFQPVVGPTGPNVLTALTGTAHGWYAGRPDPRPRPWYSIFDELTAHRRSWKIYYALPPWVLRGTVWHQIIPPGHARDLTTASRFFTDLSRGRLPAFSFVRPGVGYSEEPREDVGQGDAWLGQLVRAVARSRYWRSTAIFVTYDEGGGFWDHVGPPRARGYGTRIPLVIVSPWARRGFYWHRSSSVSVLSFMQHLWRMPPLTRLNATQNDLAGAFDFHQPPLPRPKLPVAPADTIGFHGKTDLLEVKAPRAHHWLTVHLEAETGGLTLDRILSGRVSLTLTRPSGITALADFPRLAQMAAGRASLRARFPAPGYYRVRAAGPRGSLGWTTIVVR
jgi:phospholipase C